MPESLSPPGVAPVASVPDSRGRATAWIAAGVLVGVSAARWQGFVYPNYLGSVIFQSGVLALLLVLAYPTRSVYPPRRALAMLLLGGYAAYSLASALWAPTPRLSVIGSLHMLFAVGWALALGYMLRERRDVRTVLRALFLAGAAAAVVALVRIGLDMAAYGYRPVTLDVVEHVQGHRNYLAMFLLAPMLLGLADLLTPWLTNGAGRGRSLELPAPLVGAGVGVMLVAFVTCKAWGGAVGLCAGLLCIFLARASWRARGLVLAGTVAGAVVLLIILNLPPVTQSLMKNAQGTRWFMWKGAVAMAADHPVVGWGSGMFMFHFADYKPTEVMRYGWLTSITLYPHNELLLVLVEGGLIGLALYLLGHLAVVGRFLKTAEGSDLPARIAAWALFGGLAAMFLHGLVEVALRFWAPAAMYWTLLGLLIAIPQLEDGQKRVLRPDKRRDRDPTLFAGASLGVLALAVGTVGCGALAEWSLKGALVGRRVTSEEYLQRQEEAASLSRYLPDYMVALRSRADELRERARLPEAIAAYAEIERVAPGYGPVRRLLGLLHFENARRLAATDPEAARRELAQAQTFLTRAAAQYPFDPLTRFDLARVWRASGNRIEAANELDRAAALCKPDNPLLARIRTMRQSLESDR